MSHTLFVRAVLLAALAATSPPASAAQRSAALAGASLAVETPCAAEIVIQPSSGLQGQSTITATADHQEELDRLVFDTQNGPHISTGRRNCWRPVLGLSFAPTLHLSIQVPAGTPLLIDESGVGHYVVGDIGGKLTVNISGAAHVEAGRTTALKADLSGTGGLTVAAITGEAAVQMSGYGAVDIGSASAPKLSIDLSGVGSFAVGTGSIGSASLEDSGAGKIDIGATIGDAVADVSGIGSVRLARVTGTLHKTVSGMGSVTVGN